MHYVRTLVDFGILALTRCLLLQVTDTSVKYLAQGCAHLNSLDLSQCSVRLVLAPSCVYLCTVHKVVTWVYCTSVPLGASSIVLHNCAVITSLNGCHRSILLTLSNVVCHQATHHTFIPDVLKGKHHQRISNVCTYIRTYVHISVLSTYVPFNLG